MYEFIYFLQLSCTNSYIFCRSCKRARATSTRHERTARAESAQRKPRGRSQSSPPALTRPRAIFVDPILFIYSNLDKESDQNIQIRFYMQHRFDFI